MGLITIEAGSISDSFASFGDCFPHTGMPCPAFDMPCLIDIHGGSGNRRVDGREEGLGEEEEGGKVDEV